MVEHKLKHEGEIEDLYSFDSIFHDVVLTSSEFIAPIHVCDP